MSIFESQIISNAIRIAKENSVLVREFAKRKKVSPDRIRTRLERASFEARGAENNPEAVGFVQKRGFSPKEARFIVRFGLTARSPDELFGGPFFRYDHGPDGDFPVI